ncbi:MAG TPA: Fur family transcriptional regulator [Beijerinckiaceae bacterium]|nr:Fur family transcriptional regulator [Beijerinckiaceae bacterium]
MRENFVEACRRHGLRITGPRKIIAEALSAAHDHPDVRELHRRVMERDPTVSLSTVYRTLRQFADIGLIEQHTFDGRSVRIERAPTAHHDHLIDTQSGRVIEFSSPEIEALQIEIARRLGYELTGHRLELYGRPLAAKKR